jgi:hypothetical protein
VEEGLIFIRAVKASKMDLRAALSPENIKTECAEELAELKSSPSQLVTAVNAIDYLDASNIDQPFRTFSNHANYKQWASRWLEFAKVENMNITIRRLFRDLEWLGALALPKYTNTVLIRSLKFLSRGQMAHEALHWLGLQDGFIMETWELTGPTEEISFKIERDCL